MSIVGSNLADRGAALDSSPMPPRPGELSIFGSIRHYRKLVIAIILASILADGAYVVTRPAEYTATAIVVVKEPGNIPVLGPQTTVSPDRYVADQAVILSSISVAQMASQLGASQRLPVIRSADYFQHHTTVTTSEATSNQITIAFSAPTQDEAVGGSDAVVRAYLKVVSDRLAAPLDAATSDIDSKIADINRQLELKSSTGPPASELLSRRAVLTSRRDELTTEAAARGNGVELYVAAASASESARRNALPLAVVVILAGALLSVATAFVLGALRRPLTRAHDGAAILGAPLVAVVPAFRSGRSGLVGPGRERHRSNASAAFRWAAASLPMRTPGSPSIAVVSARAGDGRSTMTANLGLALADSGIKTLLIDGCSDGNLSHMLLGDQDDGPGWTDVVDGHADLGTAITAVKVQDSLLWVLRPGLRGGVTSAMLPWAEGGTRLTALVRALELDYYVLLDTPALLSGADGSALTAAAGSVLVVVRDNSLAGDLEQLGARLALTGTPASWCVVNHRPSRWSPLARRMKTAGDALRYRFDDRIHNGAELAEAAGISLTTEVEVDGAGTLADSRIALAYAGMAAHDPAARIFMLAGVAAQDRSGPTAASLSVAAENAGKRSVVLRAEPETESVSQPLSAEAPSTTAPASETLLDLIQTIRASRSRKFAFLAVPSLLVSPMALTMARRVDAAVLVATARRTHAAEVKQAAEALQGAGLKIVAAILLTAPRSSGANGATAGKTRWPISRRLVALAGANSTPARALARTLARESHFVTAGRRPAGGSEQPQPITEYGQDPCSEAACARQHGAPCEYVDRRGKECPTTWCPEHQCVVGEAVYCRRHATVMAALLTLPEEDRERPDLDNRAPSLLEHVARRLHQPAVQMLQAKGAEYPGSSIGVDALHMTMAGTPRIRGWEHRWRLHDHTGPLATIGIRVDEATDSLVQVKVDGTVVHTAEPPWIAARTAGSDEEDAARRQAYDQELINAMFESLQRRHEFRY